MYIKKTCKRRKNKEIGWIYPRNLELEMNFAKWAKQENLRKTQDPEHELCWHQQVIDMEINTAFPACNNDTHLQEHKIPVGCGLKIIGYCQRLENVMNLRNLSLFGSHRYRRPLVKFCLFISYLIVIAQVSERNDILNTPNWENYFYLSILASLIKSFLNKYEIEKNCMSLSSKNIP